LAAYGEYDDTMNVQRFSGYANAYLIDGTVLIDAGINPREISEHDFESIELIILTHCHFDHTSAASAIAEVAGADIAIHSADFRLLGDDYATASTLFGEHAPQITPDTLLKGGETFEFDDLRLDVIHTPGHTPGSICIYEPATGSLFSGDTIFPDGGIGRCDLGGDISALAHSIELLAALGVATLYPGHLDTTDTGVSAQIRSSLAHAQGANSCTPLYFTHKLYK
jgi:glyoxylase-like metal-dependent hydrolase (beta-lactamase superfamily II)